MARVSVSGVSGVFGGNKLVLQFILEGFHDELSCVWQYCWTLLFLFCNLKVNHLRMASKRNKMCSWSPNYLLTQTKVIAHARYTFSSTVNYTINSAQKTLQKIYIRIVNFTQVSSPWASMYHLTFVDTQCANDIELYWFLNKLCKIWKLLLNALQ